MAEGDEDEKKTFRVTIDPELLDQLQQAFPAARNRTELIRKAIDLSLWERREWLEDEPKSRKRDD
ncbi:MAG: hypothetical protein ABEI76_08590 [Halobacteriales archaeon]